MLKMHQPWQLWLEQNTQPSAFWQHPFMLGPGQIRAQLEIAQQTIAALGFLVLGVITLLLRNYEYLTDTAASIALAILIVAAVSSYFVIERAYKDKNSLASK